MRLYSRNERPSTCKRSSPLPHYVTKLIQDEELRIIRPRIENTQQGQEALKKHLSLMQHLKKEATQVEEQKNALRDEYFEHYADKMNYAEFIAMKQGKKGGAKK